MVQGHMSNAPEMIKPTVDSNIHWETCSQSIRFCCEKHFVIVGSDSNKMV